MKTPLKERKMKISCNLKADESETEVVQQSCDHKNKERAHGRTSPPDYISWDLGVVSEEKRRMFVQA